MVAKKRAAAHKRSPRRAPPARTRVPDLPDELTPAQGGETARIRMSAPATSPTVRGSGAPEDAPIEAPAATLPELADQARASLERVFSPEVSMMVMSTAFGVAAVVTGEPDIYTPSDDELEPLAPAFGRQISRIPIVKAAGPDNTELGILILGLGLIVTRMLNEHARKRQTANATASASPEQRREEIRATARRAPVPATGNAAELEDGAREPHFGMRV
jgi:hypothetical protein